MESIVEFALYTWVAVSILAVLVQLVRIVRYRRANAAATNGDAATSDGTDLSAKGPVTIDLDRQTEAPAAVEQATPTSPAVETVPSELAAAGSSTRAPVAPASPPEVNVAPPSLPTRPSPPSGSAEAPPADAPLAPPAMPTSPPEASMPPPPPPVEPPAPVEEALAASSAELAGPTLADLLAGVRLPWNLLPTVDHSREPSNDRVVLSTTEGEPADVGADVADELERLGFVITTRGEDTAIATRGDDVLGLQIIPDAAGATANNTTRFPNATGTSVALDIWIER